LCILVDTPKVDVPLSFQAVLVVARELGRVGGNLV